MSVIDLIHLLLKQTPSDEVVITSFKNGVYGHWKLEKIEQNELGGAISLNIKELDAEPHQSNLERDLKEQYAEHL